MPDSVPPNVATVRICTFQPDDRWRFRTMFTKELSLRAKKDQRLRTGLGDSVIERRRRRITVP